MSVLIATPCFNQMASEPYLASCLNLRKELVTVGLDHDFMTIGNESLIVRGRNIIASSFLSMTRFATLLLIDADIEYTPPDVAKLWNLSYEQIADVAVGPYRMKEAGAPLAAWRNGQLQSVEGETEPFDVDYAGTGFMLIKRATLERLKDHPDVFDYAEGKMSPDGKTEGQCWNFFDSAIAGDLDKSKPWTERHYLPEDYWFCSRVRSMGMKVIMDPTIKLKHYGQAAY